MHLYTFHTPGYSGLASRCISGFAKFGVTVRPIVMHPQGDWMANILNRALQFGMLADSHPDEPCGFVDADLEVLGDPILIKEWESVCKDHDIACTMRPWMAPHNQVCAGIVLFPNVNQTMQEWISRCRSDLQTSEPCREQVYLLDAINRTKARVLDLGVGYNSPTRDDCVIYHSHEPKKAQYRTP